MVGCWRPYARWPSPEALAFRLTSNRCPRPTRLRHSSAKNSVPSSRSNPQIKAPCSPRLNSSGWRHKATSSVVYETTTRSTSCLEARRSCPSRASHCAISGRRRHAKCRDCATTRLRPKKNTRFASTLRTRVYARLFPSMQTKTLRRRLLRDRRALGLRYFASKASTDKSKWRRPSIARASSASTSI